MSAPIRYMSSYGINWRTRCLMSHSHSDELPEAWNDLMSRFFGLDTRGDFANGVMQDVHWYAGLFGYFPCYTLGALTAAQLYQTFTSTNRDAEAQFAAGNFETVLNWLRENIHSKAQLTSGFDRIVEITGETIDHRSFCFARYRAVSLII